jgi:hypothetical protein
LIHGALAGSSVQTVPCPRFRTADLSLARIGTENCSRTGKSSSPGAPLPIRMYRRRRWLM